MRHPHPSPFPNVPRQLRWLRMYTLIRSTVCVSSGRPDDGYCTIGRADIHGMTLELKDTREGSRLDSNQELISGKQQVDWTIRLIVINSKLSGANSFQATTEYCFGKSGLIAISVCCFCLYEYIHMSTRPY